MRLLECVPNISEGRDLGKIASIAEEVRKHKGVKLLDYSSDKDHHRSVFTFIGEPEAIKDAAFSLAMKAIDLIDMRVHQGGHPRLGAVDVVPFVPIQGVEMEEVIQIAHEFGKGLGKRGIPIYFYEEAATSQERKDLPSIRKGGYEGLVEKLKDPKWKPDEGPDHFNPKTGVTIVGARFPLVAYNVNLKTKDLNMAKEIAQKVRFKDGGFPHVRAMGVDLKEKGMVQVSMNLTNYRVTNIPKVYEFIKEEALKKGIEIEGSEIVGLVPLGVLEGIARNYLKCPQFSIHQAIEQRILEFE
ncbi:MAG: glutamate formimidoyltransferase [Deltaproteobacteria bacterium CG_4_8_14_3_um_filter_45_9]|nr:MAG: glutamate formimidoyltransferase [Deltaproteobacteria bacterium CG_4_8_14_3_um_filter_45_9]